MVEEESKLEKKTVSLDNFEVTEINLIRASDQEKFEIISQYKGKFIGILERIRGMRIFSFGQMSIDEVRGGFSSQVSKTQYELYPHGEPRDNDSGSPHHMDYRDAVAVIIFEPKNK